MTDDYDKKHNRFCRIPSKGRGISCKIKKYYFSVFGWTFKDWGKDFIDTSSNGVDCGFNGDSTHHSKVPLVVIYTDNLEAAQEEIISQGGKITKNIFPFPGGKRFHFLAPSGHELTVWSDK